MNYGLFLEIQMQERKREVQSQRS